MSPDRLLTKAAYRQKVQCKFLIGDHQFNKAVAIAAVNKNPDTEIVVICIVKGRQGDGPVNEARIQHCRFKFYFVILGIAECNVHKIK